MEELGRFENGYHIDIEERETKVEEDEEEFRSCVAEEEEWRDTDESAGEESKEELDEPVLKIFFKGVSISPVSGIGIVMEKSRKVIVHQVQKKLDFYVEDLVAEHLALIDGLLEAIRKDTNRVFAFTDSEIVYDQITRGERLDNQLLVALRDRILEHINRLESFVLKLVPSSEVEKPRRLAQEAAGLSPEGIEDCSICCEGKISSQMIVMKCSHKFCSNCMIKYVDGKLQISQVPIRCPELKCEYYISASECRSFLPVTCYESLERALLEADILDSEKIYCPYPNCSVLLNPRQCLSTRASSSSQSETSCIECPECQRLICIDCSVPWHSSMSCEEYQNLPMEERDAGDITLHRLAQNQKWRRCQQCRRMIELTQGCYHLTCWCGHEFCYSCGAEYMGGLQTCQCAFWDDEYFDNLVPSSPHQNMEPWRWDAYDSLPTALDAYSEQERTQLALVQRFLTGGFNLSDHQPCQSPPHCSDSYLDTMKDLHQLPWLERFVSVISDNYYDDYVQ